MLATFGINQLWLAIANDLKKKVFNSFVALQFFTRDSKLIDDIDVCSFVGPK